MGFKVFPTIKINEIINVSLETWGVNHIAQSVWAPHIFTFVNYSKLNNANICSIINSTKGVCEMEEVKKEITSLIDNMNEKELCSLLKLLNAILRT